MIYTCRRLLLVMHTIFITTALIFSENQSGSPSLGCRKNNLGLSFLPIAHFETSVTERER